MFTQNILFLSSCQEEDKKIAFYFARLFVGIQSRNLTTQEDRDDPAHGGLRAQRGRQIVFPSKNLKVRLSQSADINLFDGSLSYV